MGIDMANSRWANYCSVFLDDFTPSNNYFQLHKVVLDEELAKIIDYHFKENSTSWLSTPLDALDGDAPDDCLITPAGLERLKNMLMRMPC